MARNESLARGAFVLMVAGLIIRVSGLIYQIPLAAWLGGEGIGIYRMALPAFWAFYKVAVGGIPAALTNLVSEYRSRGRAHVAEEAFRLALAWTTALATAAAGALVLGAPYLAQMIGEPRTELTLVVLAPAIYFFAVQQVYGAYLQGRQIMTPWALANVLEQAGRIAAALAGAWYLQRFGLAWGAAGAALGAAAGGLISDLYLVWIHREVRERSRPRWDPGDPPARLAWRMFTLAWPLTAGGAVLPLLNFVDVALIQRGLTESGFTTAAATELYGQFSGMAYTLVTMPNVFALGLASALAPAVTTAFAGGHLEAVRQRCLAALRATALIGLPAALLMAVLAAPLMQAIFRAPRAAPILVASAPVALLSPLMLVVTGALQGMGRTGPPMRNLLLTMALKVALDSVLSRVPGLGIYGVAGASVLTYALSAWLNVRELERALNWRVDWRAVLGAPLLAAAGMAAGVGLLVASEWTLPRAWGTVATALMVAPPLYALLLGLTRAVTWADLRELAGPVAPRLERLLHWWPF